MENGQYSPEELAELLDKYGVGFRAHDDELFLSDNERLFPPYVRLGVYSHDDEESFHRSAKIGCCVPNCFEKFETVYAFDSHYNARHRFRCSQCGKMQASAHLLDLHLSEVHDSFFAVQATRKPMYACYLEECLHKSKDIDERRHHCIEQHKFPADFRFDPNKWKTKSKKGKPGKGKPVAEDSEEAMETGENNKARTVVQWQHKVFSFGQNQSKKFVLNNSYAKQLTKNTKAKHPANVLEDKTVIADLMESLPID